MSLQDITITGSIGSIATQSYGQRTYISSTDEQSFPIEHITGSYAGAWPDFVLRNINSNNSASNTTVNLIVNVTQSWSGSNTTPLGIVPFIHDTMEEFIDGEFSGSNYTVTNGSLVDDDCKQFLTVNTTPTNYSIFPYNYTSTIGAPFTAYLSSAQFNVFINNLTAPPNGGILLFRTNNPRSQSFPNPNLNQVRITHLKISRFDKEGNDNTLSLQELTEIRWTDSNVGFIDLKILSISEYPTYYLYSVLSKTWTSTTNQYFITDDNILNYSLSASSAAPSASAGLMYIDNWIWDPTKISGGTFNGVWTFDVTPNTSSIYTASITAYNGNASTVTFDFNFVENTYVGSDVYFNTIAQTQSVSISSLQSKTFTLRGTVNSLFIGNPSVQYHLETNNLTSPISLSNTFWIITQSVAPQTFTSSVVIEPYLLSNFANSDCDVLMNNYSQNDISTNYREVLYDSGGSTPSNLQQIIDHTAEFAQVNDYIFTARSSTIPRFEGSRTTSPDINQPYVSGFTNKELSILDTASLNITASNLANIDITTPYFAYFEKVSSPLPRSLYGSKLTVTRLVDAGGTSLPLDGSNTNLFSLENIFRPNTSASIFYIVTTNNSESINNVETTITDSGVDYKNVFYFQSKTNAGSPGQYGYNSGQITMDMLTLNTNPAQPNPYFTKTYNSGFFSSYFNMLSLTSGSPNLVSFKYTIGDPFNWPFGSSGLGSPSQATNPYYGTGFFVGLGLTLKSPYLVSSENWNNYNDYPWIKFYNQGSNTAIYDFSSSLFPLKKGDYIRVWNVTQGVGSNATYGTSYSDSEVLLTQQLNNTIEGMPPYNDAPVYSETKKISNIEVINSGLFYPTYGNIPGNTYSIENWPIIADNPIVVTDTNNFSYVTNGVDETIWTVETQFSSSINDIIYSTYYDTFIAVGDNGLILTSTNGKDWNQFIPTALNNAVPNFNGRLTAISANINGTVYIVGDNSIILTNAGFTSLNNITTSSLWNTYHPYPDSRYSFTCVYNPTNTGGGGATSNNDVVIGGYDNLLNSGSLVGYINPDGFTSASFSKLTNINSVYLDSEYYAFGASGPGIGIAVGDDGLIIPMTNSDGNGVAYISKGINQISKSLANTAAGYPGFSGSLYSVDLRPLDHSVYAVGESGSTIYDDGTNGIPFSDPSLTTVSTITTGDLKRIKRFETSSIYNTVPFLSRYKSTLINAQNYTYIIVGDNGYFAIGDNFGTGYDPFTWTSSSIGGNLINIAAGETTTSNNNAVNLYTDSPWGDGFPYGTFDQQTFTTSLQGFRIFRGEASDQGIYISDDIPDGVGFIVPENYNPEYNYLEIARKAGLISG
jgi:hypothetical protein